MICIKHWSYSVLAIICLFIYLDRIDERKTISELIKKFNGIKRLLDIINQRTNQNITLDNVVYFDDNFNYMSVFENLKYAIAVENVIPEIKVKAYAISCNANNGALGHYLEKIWQ